MDKSARGVKDRLHRCRWRMLEMKLVGDNNKILSTFLATLVTNIHYLKRCNQHRNSVTNIHKSSLTLSRQHQNGRSIYQKCHNHKKTSSLFKAKSLWDPFWKRTKQNTNEISRFRIGLRIQWRLKQNML